MIKEYTTGIRGCWQQRKIVAFFSKNAPYMNSISPLINSFILYDFTFMPVQMEDAAGNNFFIVRRLL